MCSSDLSLLSTVRDCADTLLGIINDILDFSKIEAGKLELRPEPFSLHAAVEEIVGTLALRAHQKGLELICNIPSSLQDAVIGDCGRLRQILVNLIGNALKFTQTGEIVVSAELEDENAEQVSLRFSVRDTGIGIPKEKHKAIFEAFNQADNSDTRVYGGTGLGLTISAQLVSMMKGRIWVESAVGAGSKFFFTVVMQKQKDAAVRASARAFSLQGLPLLIVDDNSTNRRYLEEVAACWQMTPASLDNANEALQSIQERKKSGSPFAVVLIDANMPSTDGYTLASLIRQNPECSVPVILMLASNDQIAGAARCKELEIGRAHV